MAVKEDLYYTKKREEAESLMDKKSTRSTQRFFELKFLFRGFCYGY
ncbi:MAG: hypothetical protein KAV80_05305 [Methanomicrobia archaeon]|nr:hypothetical protein [Methanomicrobia archaeon]